MEAGGGRGASDSVERGPRVTIQSAASRWRSLAVPILACIALAACQPGATAYPSLPIGACGLELSSGAFDTVECSSPHTHVLAAHVTDPNTGCPPGSSDWVTPDSSGDFWDCWRPVDQESPHP